MKRKIEKYLDQWRSDRDRKVLLLRGARQVGKTYSVREFGKDFKYFLEVNFESERSIHQFFSGDLNPEDICHNLAAYYNTTIKAGETLLFFDEIQACIPAISSLRFFQEKMPGLHLVAAGSLLEFALRELPSFGVGRIQFLYMYPMSFNEFLEAQGENNLLEMISHNDAFNPINAVFHRKLLNYLKIFFFTGGLPEVVQTYIQTKDLRKVQSILERLINGFEDDFVKYNKHVPAYRLREVFQAVARQSGNKFVLTKASENAGIEQVKYCLDLLEMAGLIHKVKHSSAHGIPIGAGTDPKKFKLLMFDHGIFQRVLGLELSEFLIADDRELINRGNLAEQFAGTELIKYGDPQSKQSLYYWHREKKGSSSEVDFLVQRAGNVVPVEIKSGTQGKMQSLWIFMKEKKSVYGIRCSLENFALYSNIRVYPLYALELI